MAETQTVPAPTPAAGSGTLADRVQSLRLPPPTASRGRSGAIPWLIALICLAASVYLALGGSLPYVPRMLATTAPPAAKPAEPVADVSAAPSPEPGDKGATSGSKAPSATTRIALEAKGYVIPEQQILVSPQVSGRVVELNFEAGQHVKQGEVLAVLEATEYKADYERAVAEVESAKERLDEANIGFRPNEIRAAGAELAEAKTQLDQAERDFKRKQGLFKQQIVTAQDVEDAESQYLALVKRVDRLTATWELIIEGPRAERKRIAAAELRRAEADLARAKWRLDNTTIVAPITGTILKKNAELGNLVNPIAFNGSYSLCDIADLSKLEVELSIQERDIAKVFKDQKCRVRPEAFPDRVYEGYVSRLMPIADRAKGAVPVRVRLTVPPAEEGQYLKPEMGATVTFFQESVQPAVPVSAAER